MHRFWSSAPASSDNDGHLSKDNAAALPDNPQLGTTEGVSLGLNVASTNESVGGDASSLSSAPTSTFEHTGEQPADPASLTEPAPAAGFSTSHSNATEIQVVSFPPEINSPTQESQEAAAPARPRRISFRSFAFFYGRDAKRGTLSTEENLKKVHEAEEAGQKKKKSSKRSIRRDEKSAKAVRTIIVGPVLDKSGKSKPLSQASITRVQGQLLNPKRANKIIAQLRAMPMPGEAPTQTVGGSGEVVSENPIPIHAVCLDCSDEEADALHFARLTNANAAEPSNIASAELTSLVPVLRDMKLVTLVSSPDLGVTQPMGGDGLLAGAIPSAVTFGEGLTQITQQLLALGYATTQAIMPDHTGIYPPTDRMSILTYWWGLEVCLPPPTIKYLSNVKSISNASLNFLTAFALFSNGVREILPFVRYISQYMEFQFNAIKAQDKGQGVVCASTWVMPAALVPRPWPFPPPPPPKPDATKASLSNPVSIPAPGPSRPPQPPSNEPILAFPGSRGGLFTPNTPLLPPVLVTPPTLPRGAKISVP